MQQVKQAKYHLDNSSLTRNTEKSISDELGNFTKCRRTQII